MAAGSLATWLRGGTKGRGHNVRLQRTASGGFTGHVDQSDLGIVVSSAAANAATTTEIALTLDHLPYELKIEILRRLDPSSIVAASQTCRSWRAIASDLSLWRQILERDMISWPFVCSQTLPNHHQRCREPKQAYMRCSPLSHGGVVRERRLAKAALVPRGSRRVAVFGLGLEHAATNLVDNLLWAPQSPFRVIGMSPGLTGIGGGVTLRHYKNYEMDMIVLFQKTAAERRQRDDRSPGRLQAALSPAARAVCAGVHGYIFVVDALRMAQDAAMEVSFHCDRALAELQQLLNPAWAPRQAPLVVFACHGHAEADMPARRGGDINAEPELNRLEEEAEALELPDVAPLTSVQVAEALRLATLAPRPWRVEMVDVSAYGEPVTRATQWLMVSSQQP